MSKQYIGRVSFKHFKGVPDFADTPRLEAKKRLIEDFMPKYLEKYPSVLFVYEEGEEREPHAHFYLETDLSEGPVRKMLQAVFSLPVRVGYAQETKMHTYMHSFLSFFSFFVSFF